MDTTIEEMTPCMRNTEGDYSLNPGIVESLRDFYMKHDSKWGEQKFAPDVADGILRAFAVAHYRYKPTLAPYEVWFPFVKSSYAAFQDSGVLPDYVLRSYELLVERGAIHKGSTI